MTTFSPLLPFTGQSGAKLAEAAFSLRSRLATVSAEAITGRSQTLAVDLKGRVGDAFLVEKALSDIASERDRLSLREARLGLVQTSLDRVGLLSNGLDARALGSIGLENAASLRTVATEARSSLDDIISTLNVQHGTRFLFSGDATSTPPFVNAAQLVDDVRVIATAATSQAEFVTALDVYFNDTAGGFRQAIYQGSDSASSPGSFTGVEPGIIDTLRGFTVIALAAPDEAPPVISGNPGIISLAAGDVARGRDRLIELRSDIGIAENRIKAATALLDLEETVLTQAFNDLTARDALEAATELRNLEANLEATYALTSRLANLSLLNFLR